VWDRKGDVPGSRGELEIRTRGNESTNQNSQNVTREKYYGSEKTEGEENGGGWGNLQGPIKTASSKNNVLGLPLAFQKKGVINLKGENSEVWKNPRGNIGRYPCPL